MADPTTDGIWGAAAWGDAAWDFILDAEQLLVGAFTTAPSMAGQLTQQAALAGSPSSTRATLTGVIQVRPGTETA